MTIARHSGFCHLCNSPMNVGADISVYHIDGDFRANWGHSVCVRKLVQEKLMGESYSSSYPFRALPQIKSSTLEEEILNSFKEILKPSEVKKEESSKNEFKKEMEKIEADTHLENLGKHLIKKVLEELNKTKADILPPVTLKPIIAKVIQQELESTKSELGRLYKNSQDYLMKEMSSAKEILALEVQKSIKSIPPTVIDLKFNDKIKRLEGEFFAKEFETILFLANAAKETGAGIFIPGPTGCGKTHIARQVAKALDRRFGFISCSSGMSEGQLLGRLIPIGSHGTFTYVPAEFVDCYEKGGVFLLDEIDAADENTLIVLNAGLANGHLAVPNRADNPYAKKNKEFVLIAAANTYGRGADRMYVGRNQLDEATLNRFDTVEMDYDPFVELNICNNKDVLTQCLRYRYRIAKNKLKRTISTRQIQRYCFYANNGKNMNFIEQIFFCGWSDNEAKLVRHGHNTPDESDYVNKRILLKV